MSVIIRPQSFYNWCQDVMDEARDRYFYQLWGVLSAQCVSLVRVKYRGHWWIGTREGAEKESDWKDYEE